MKKDFKTQIDILEDHNHQLMEELETMRDDIKERDDHINDLEKKTIKF